jgi:ATP-dependent protease ClpP protease subunit
MSEDFKIMPMMQATNTFTTEVRGTQFTYYLTGPIEAPENYVDLCNILRTAGPQDEVIIRINSRGGFVSSERMIVNAIMESQANVKGFIEYDCMSAATGVFLACSAHGWGEHIQFMAHCAWWGSVGKNPDVKSQTEFGIKQMEEEIETTYQGLLSPEEITQCNDGKEFWFGAKELEERMMRFYDYHK